MSLTREQIIQHPVETEIVEVPEWGGNVYMRSMSGADRAEFDGLSDDKKEGIYGAVRFLIKVLCDENGALIFSEDDIEILAGKSVVTISRLFDKALYANKISKESIEDLEKKLSAGQSAGFTSA